MGLCETRWLLYIDDLKLISGCTSFTVHDEFLLLTTNTHVCHFVSLQSEPKGAVWQLLMCDALVVLVTQLCSL